MSDTSKSLQGKLAIVTGAAKPNGVGFATAFALAQQGADIVIHYNSSKTAAEESVEKLKKFGVKAISVHADAATKTFGTDIVNATLEAFPKRTIDILVNNAGNTAVHGKLSEVPVEEFDKIFHVNVRSIFLLIQAADAYLTVPGARIINIGSVVARIGLSIASFYSGSKAALHGLTRAWAQEFAERGITVNVASLGPIGGTGMAFPEGNPYLQRFHDNQHIKRNGTPEDVAEAILFLASPGSAFITGQVLNIDGGLTYA
ncbi:putative short-chain dehydrogenases/reductase [Trichoderma chlorosporum]